MKLQTRKRIPVAIAAIFLAAPAAQAAVALPPTVPVVYSYVNANTSLSGVVTLTGFDQFSTYKSYDSDYNVSTTRNVAATVNRSFAQWDGSTIDMSGYANADFGVHKVAVASSGASAPGKYQTYGSIAPTQAYADQYIGNVDPNAASYEYDANNNRNVYIAPGVNYHFDPNTNDLVFDQAGSVLQPSWDQGVNYFVPNQPEVTIDLKAERSVSAYSRWEDIFYFEAGGGHPPSSGGVAKFTLSIDGTLSGLFTGGYQLMVRDWQNKDVWANFLAYDYQSATSVGEAVSKTVDVLIPFTYGTPNYVKSELQAWLYGEGDIDFSHTVKIDSVTLPEDVAIFSYSGYLTGQGLGFDVVGGIDGNTLPGGSNGYFNSGSGGGGNPVPVPAAVWLLGSGLVGLAVRTRRKAA